MTQHEAVRQGIGTRFPWTFPLGETTHLRSRPPRRWAPRGDKMRLLTVLAAGAVSLVSTQAFATTAANFCAAAANPCVINASANIDANSVLDFGSREVQLTGGTLKGLGSFSIRAGRFVQSGGTKVITINGGSVSFSLTQDFAMAGGGGTAARIDTGQSSPGNISIVAGTGIVVGGVIAASSTDADSDGGNITLSAGTSVTASNAISSQGGSASSGGTLQVLAGTDIDLSAAIDLRGGEYDGGSIDLTGRHVLMNGSVDMSSTSGGADGGDLTIVAMGHAWLYGPVVSNGSGADGWGYDGGDVDVMAGAEITVQNELRLRSGAPDGTGGSISLDAGTTVSTGAGFLNVGGNGSDSAGGSIAVTADGAISLGPVSATGGSWNGGSLNVVGQSSVTMGTIDARGGGGDGNGGKINIKGKAITSAGNIQASGPWEGGDIVMSGCSIAVNAGISWTATGTSKGLGSSALTYTQTASIAGSIATNGNTIVYKTTAPSITGSMSPSPTVTQNTSLFNPCAPVCGNSVIESGETCDDGNTTTCDGCSSSCQTQRCGNGVVECGEVCDAGSSNGSPGSGCTFSCTVEVVEVCGDAIVTSGEECDDGSDNGTPSSPCLETCELQEVPDVRIPGNGSRSLDCAVEWSLAHEDIELLTSGIPSRRQTCVDNDPGCDFDPEVGSCELHIWACFGAEDTRLECIEQPVASVSVMSPSTRATGDAADVRTDLLEGLSSLAGVSLTEETCTGVMKVPLAANGKKISIKTRAYIEGSTKKDVDSLQLTCEPL